MSNKIISELQYKDKDSISSNNRTYVPCKGKYKISSKDYSNGVIDDYIRESANFSEIKFNGYSMPKSGERKNDDCGRWSIKACFNVTCHRGGMEYGKRFKRSCDDALCPECGDTWLHKEAKRASDKIKAYAKRFRKPSKHLVWSPDPTNLKFAGMGVREMRKIARSDLKEVGCEGGMMILHMFRDRIVDDVKQWYVSPHFHCVGFGWIKVTKEWHARSKAIITNLGVRDSVYNTISYQLSHASIKKGSQTVTWFGTMSNGKMKWYKAPSTVERCPYCNERLIVAEFTEVFEPPPLDWNNDLLPVGSFCVLNSDGRWQSE